MMSMTMISGRIFIAVLVLASICLNCADVSGSDQFRFPIRVSENGRYFEDQNGKPVLIHGDSAWSLIAQLNLKEAEYYLNHRKAQGFNAIIVNLIERKFSANPPRNALGDQPFLRPGDLSTPNERYFSHADAVITMAARKGILVFLVPAYLGWKGGEEGWFQEIRIAGAEKLRIYGRYVASRYKAFSNIVWVVGGDFTPPRQYQWSVDTLAEGIREGGATQLMTAHCGQESPAGAFGNRKWLDFNNVYSYDPSLYVETLKEYHRQPIRPFILIESLYENEHASTPDRIRQQAYWSLLTGAAGHFYGNNPVWNFGSPQKVFPTEQPWEEALNSRSAKDMAQLRKLFGQIRWNTMVPDMDHRFLVTGYGQAASPRYSTAAVAPGGKAAIVYVATEAPAKLTVELNGAPAGYKAMWVDPTDGRMIHIDMTTELHGKRKELSIPTVANHSGANDWILYLQTK